MKELLLFIESKEIIIEELHQEIDRLKSSINNQEVAKFKEADKQKLFESSVKLNLLSDLILELKSMCKE